MASSGELRIGVIGAGGRGWLAKFAHMPEKGVRVVAGVDIVPKALEQFKQAYGPDVFVCEDYRDMIKRPDVDAVFVTTPDYCHEEHATAACLAGKHVYLEKPMAITIAGCDRIMAAARKAGVRLYLGHNMRHFPVVRKMKELIDSGAIGEPKVAWCRHFVCYGCDAYFKDWHADRTKSTSLLLQKGAHDIDVLHWLCHGYSKRVTAMGGLTLYDRITDRHPPSERGDNSWSVENWPPLSQKGLNPIIDVEDVSMMLMHLDNGVFASYQQCHYAPDGWRNYTVIGTEGRVENFGDVPGPETVVRLWDKRAYYYPTGNAEFHFPPLEGSHGGADPRIVEEFIRYVRQGGKVATSPVAGRFSVAAGCCAAESLRNNAQPVDVPQLPADLRAHFEADEEK
jgi:predicted dehydrogenase